MKCCGPGANRLLVAAIVHDAVLLIQAPIDPDKHVGNRAYSVRVCFPRLTQQQDYTGQGRRTQGSFQSNSSAI